MSADITIRPADGTWVIRAGGAVIGESTNAMAVTENGYDPVIYFPREDVAMAFLDRSPDTTDVPGKGTASHYSIASKSRTYRNAVWTYESPESPVADLKDLLAFEVQDGVAVEQV